MKDLLHYEKLLPHSYQISNIEKNDYSTLTMFIQSLCLPIEKLIDDTEESYKYFDINKLSGSDLDRFGSNWNVKRNGKLDYNYRITILAYMSAYISGGTKEWFSKNLPTMLDIKNIRIFEKYPAKAVISPEGVIDLPTMQEITKFSKPLGVDIMWGIIWLIMKEQTWEARKLKKWLYYRTGGVHTGDMILPGYNPGFNATPNPKMISGIGVTKGVFGYFDVANRIPAGIENVVNLGDNGVFSDLPKPI